MKARPIEPKLPTVKLERLKGMIASLEKSGVVNDDTDLTFEYIVGSLYPTIYQNVMDEMKKQYTLGYIQGQEDKENESKGNS